MKQIRYKYALIINNEVFIRESKSDICSLCNISASTILRAEKKGLNCIIKPLFQIYFNVDYKGFDDRGSNINEIYQNNYED